MSEWIWDDGCILMGVMELWMMEWVHAVVQFQAPSAAAGKCYFVKLFFFLTPLPHVNINGHEYEFLSSLIYGVLTLSDGSVLLEMVTLKCVCVDKNNNTDCHFWTANSAGSWDLISSSVYLQLVTTTHYVTYFAACMT